MLNAWVFFYIIDNWFCNKNYLNLKNVDSILKTPSWHFKIDINKWNSEKENNGNRTKNYIFLYNEFRAKNIKLINLFDIIILDFTFHFSFYELSLSLEDKNDVI